MGILAQTIQTGDWKNEKHVPFLHTPEKIQTGIDFKVKVCIGEAIAHPNTLEHHISWIKVFFQPAETKFPIELVTFNFSAHGEGESFTNPSGVLNIKLQKSGTLSAISYCNLHGLWQNSVEIQIEA